MNNYMRLSGTLIPGYGLNVSGAMDIQDEDISGETSGTKTVNKGIKAKTLSVSLKIKYSDKGALKNLIELLQTRENGEMKIYTIVNHTANEAGITQVSCSSSVDWKEQDQLRAWEISFNLREHLSTPEKQEKREKKAEVVKEVEEGNIPSANYASEEVKAAGDVLDAMGSATTALDELTAIKRLFSAVQTPADALTIISSADNIIESLDSLTSAFEDVKAALSEMDVVKSSISALNMESFAEKLGLTQDINDTISSLGSSAGISNVVEPTYEAKTLFDNVIKDIDKALT